MFQLNYWERLKSWEGLTIWILEECMVAVSTKIYMFFFNFIHKFIIQVRNSQHQPQFAKTKGMIVLGSKLRDFVSIRGWDTCTNTVIKLVDIAMKKLQLPPQQLPPQQLPLVRTREPAVLVGLIGATVPRVFMFLSWRKFARNLVKFAKMAKEERTDELTWQWLLI